MMSSSIGDISNVGVVSNHDEEDEIRDLRSLNISLQKENQVHTPTQSSKFDATNH
jgi:hypothetical protein